MVAVNVMMIAHGPVWSPAHRGHQGGIAADPGVCKLRLTGMPLECLLIRGDHGYHDDGVDGRLGSNGLM